MKKRLVPKETRTFVIPTLGPRDVLIVVRLAVKPSSTLEELATIPQFLHDHPAIVSYEIGSPHFPQPVGPPNYGEPRLLGSRRKKR